jgi:uncharacterized membrane protein
MNDCVDNIKTIEEQEKELIDKAELLFEHQKEQYESSVVRVRRLEDKALKTFGSLNLIITVALLIVRYWWGYFSWQIYTFTCILLDFTFCIYNHVLYFMGVFFQCNAIKRLGMSFYRCPRGGSFLYG